jgi:DNA replication protein DnaC
MSACERCHGGGVIHLEVGSETAMAEVCRCQLPCPTCSGSQYVIETREGYDVAAPCACQGLHTRVRLFNDACLPVGYGLKTIPGFVDPGGGNQGEIKTKLARYQATFDDATERGIVLVGQPGVGKTHLVCGLIHYFTLELGIACRFVDFFHLTDRIRGTFDKGDDESQASLIRPLVDIPVLVIDELGKGQGTAWEQTVIDQLISRRYNAGRLVFATTNFMPESWLDASSDKVKTAVGLQERVGPRIYSRLAEMSDFLHVAGPDHRTHGA